MPEIKLLDGKKIPFSKKIDGFEIANKISKSLAKEACIMSVDGELKDLSFSINKTVSVKIITAKDKEGLEVIRHDAAHILAMAVQELFPGTQVTIGPVIENGFYYDFSRKEPFTDEDLKKIENKMREIVLDTETTGLNYMGGDRIIEVGCVELTNHIPTGKNLQFYCSTDKKIGEDAIKIHGLTNEFLNKHSTFKEHLINFLMSQKKRIMIVDQDI